MVSLDSILSSSLIAWIILAIIGINLYLKKTGKTFVEMVKEILGFFKGLQEEE
ncbi:MAG: hypothetical protein JSW08_00045 [archaeon]|nr:MAG: hypothetical protein JSW08_00045 [archaeon]